jgi:hypothetical protein
VGAVNTWIFVIRYCRINWVRLQCVNTWVWYLCYNHCLCQGYKLDLRTKPFSLNCLIPLSSVCQCDNYGSCVPVPRYICRQCHYPSVAQINPFRWSPPHTATEGQPFPFSVQTLAGAPFMRWAGWGDQIFLPGTELSSRRLCTKKTTTVTRLSYKARPVTTQCWLHSLQTWKPSALRRNAGVGSCVASNL